MVSKALRLKLDKIDGAGIIYSYDSNDNREWREYNSKGDLIHYKHMSGYEELYEYDNDGNVIYSYDSDNCWTSYPKH